jgi:predicted nucleotidyltransferase
MNTLKNNFDNTIRNQFGEAMKALEKTFQDIDIDYYLIGAFVCEVWTDHIITLPDKRATRDIDFAIYINEHEQYDKLKQHLIGKAGFKEHKEPYRLLTPDYNIVDLIPFGGIEQNGEVLIKGHKKVVKLSVFWDKRSNRKSRGYRRQFQRDNLTRPGSSEINLVA